MANWEMGSEFHLELDLPFDFTSHSSHMPYNGSLFVTGRAALKQILDSILNPTSTCWIPSYICSDVYQTLEPMVSIRTYGDYPDDDSPMFGTLLARPGDIVLIQDTFGLNDPSQWHSWRRQNPEVVLIEDITHSSTQERYLRSPADHVFSSVRKSLPVADGGIVFAQEGGLRHASNGQSIGSYLKLEAMILKSTYLAGHILEKEEFRALQLAGEVALSASVRGNCLALTAQMLKFLPHHALRSRWITNNERFLEHMHHADIADAVEILLHRGNERGMFHNVLRCRNTTVRDHLRKHLIANNVFPAVHWPPDDRLVDVRAQQLSEVLLTVPTDFRYDTSDIDRLAQLVVEGVRFL